MQTHPIYHNILQETLFTFFHFFNDLFTIQLAPITRVLQFYLQLSSRVIQGGWFWCIMLLSLHIQTM